MGFLKQDAPVVDYAQWSKGTRAEKIVPMARHWAEVGFGTPVVLHLFYVVKILLYVLVAWLIALTTTGIDGFTNVAAWYAEPIVFQKVVFYTMLFEVVGLGCGFGPLNNRFFPPMGSIAVLVAAQDHSAATVAEPDPADQGRRAHAGRRAALRGAAGGACWSRCSPTAPGPIPELGTEVGVLPVWQTATILGLLAVCSACATR